MITNNKNVKTMSMHYRARLLSAVPSAVLLFSPSISNAVPLTSTANTEVEFGGSVDPICRVNHDPKARSGNLDLSSATSQKTNRVFIWCNTGQSNASTTYESINGGYLKNENGDSIPYSVRIPQTENEINLTSAQTVLQRSGTGIAGEDKGRMVWVTPQVSGFEYTGSYTDTILITVTYN